MHTLPSHSPYAKVLFSESTGVTAPETPVHRWGSRYERDYLLDMHWPGLEKFVAAYESREETKSKAVKFTGEQLVQQRDDGRAQGFVLRPQLAKMVDVGGAVTTATIFMEGDTPLVRTVQLLR